MIVGADTSTKAVALASLNDAGQLIDTILLEPKGKLALDRVIDFTTAFTNICLPELWWDGCTLLVIEQQVPGRGKTTGFWEQCLIAGMVVQQAARAGANILPLTPSAWRKQLGWPRLTSEKAKVYALEDWNDLYYPDPNPLVVSEHEAEAFCIARAGYILTHRDAA